MVTAHLDEIGLMVRHIDERGFLFLSLVGGNRLQNLDVGASSREEVEEIAKASRPDPSIHTSPTLPTQFRKWGFCGWDAIRQPGKLPMKPNDGQDRR